MPPKSQKRPRRAQKQARLPALEPSLSFAKRLQIRERFFRAARIDPRQFLHAFEQIPGLFYFVKDAQSRTMINTREYAKLLGDSSVQEIVGKRPREYLAKDLA